VRVQIVSTEFLRTATRPAEWPRGDLPEVAFVGRSNVGKSSMLNALTRSRGLARVSATPGRTRALQFFEVRYRPSPAARPRPLRLCDLPGYGYAKVSKAERAAWAAMIEDYLRQREPLRAVVLIVDARHPPMESDHDALAFLAQAGRPVVVAATKMDKLARNARGGALQRAARELGVPREAAVPFSAVEGTGADALWERLHGLASAGPAEAAPEEAAGDGDDLESEG
jgi:GTP-binding protein